MFWCLTEEKDRITGRYESEQWKKKGIENKTLVECGLNLTSLNWLVLAGNSD